MNYHGTDEFNAHTFPRHLFDDSAYKVLHDLTERMQAVSNDLYSAEEERHSYAALTPRQKKATTRELEETAKDAQASAGREAEWERVATARETAWAALPPELTAPRRYPESVKRCGGVRWPGQNDKRHPSMLGVLSAQPGWPLVATRRGAMLRKRRAAHAAEKLRAGNH